jgi:hypothetical protein
MVGWQYAARLTTCLQVVEAFAEKAYTHRVIPWKEVGAAEGTGIVHIAPAAARRTSQLGKEFDLPVIAPLDENGVYLPGFDWLTGREVLGSATSPAVAEEIFAALREKGFFYRKQRTPTATPTAGAAARSWSTGWWTNGSSAWASSTTSRARSDAGRKARQPALPDHGSRRPDQLVPQLWLRPRDGLAAQHARLDDQQKALLGVGPAHLGVRRMWPFSPSSATKMNWKSAP